MVRSVLGARPNFLRNFNIKVCLLTTRLIRVLGNQNFHHVLRGSWGAKFQQARSRGSPSSGGYKPMTAHQIHPRRACCVDKRKRSKRNARGDKQQAFSTRKQDQTLHNCGRFIVNVFLCQKITSWGQKVGKHQDCGD